MGTLDRAVKELHNNFELVINTKLGDGDEIEWNAVLTREDFLNGEFIVEKSGTAKNQGVALEDAVQSFLKPKTLWERLFGRE